MTPIPARCPNCGQAAPCIDWNSVDIGVGWQNFDEQYECPLCGVFAWASSAKLKVNGEYKRAVAWRDGEPKHAPEIVEMMVRQADAAMAEAIDGD